VSAYASIRTPAWLIVIVDRSPFDKVIAPGQFGEYVWISPALFWFGMSCPSNRQDRD
jgi:hypothetical protein